MEKSVMKKEGRKNPLVYLFSKTWRYSAGNRKKVVTFWSMFIVAESVHVFVPPFAWAKIMNVIQQEGVTAANIATLLLLLLIPLVSDLAFWSLHGPGRLLECANAFKARVTYRKHLLQGVMTLPMEWHVEHHSGDTIDKIEKGTTALYRFSEESFQIIYAMVQLIGSYVVLVYFSPPSAYIVLAMILITMWITMRFDRILLGHYQKLNRAENNISEGVFDAVSNIATVIILRVERLVFGAIVHKLEKPYELFKRNNRVNEAKWFLTNVCCTVMVIVVMGEYFWERIGLGQGILVGSVYLLINYLGRISELFFTFTRMYGEVLQQKAKVMNAEELASDFKEESFADHVLPKEWRRLSAENLNFSYHSEEGGDLHLDDVAFSAARGERIGLVGESGSGKTTLLKIMRDLYHPKSNQLAVDGHPIPQGFGGISQAISLVPQNPEIFATTIIENITLGAEHEMDFVRRFTDMACFTEVAEGLPHKFESSIKERGVNLSGGQQQRLALARGLLACDDKDIVLLDEPTSSLDTATEMKVYQNIFKGFQGKTIISSVHRLHLLPLFDRIYMFDGGRIIGMGTLDELLTSCPPFQKLWKEYHKHKDKDISASTKRKRS